MKEKICVIGLGTFGSYLLKSLVQKYGNSKEIIVIEIGNKSTKDEKEIGLKSISENSTAASDGRYFGLGGTSSRWGGQVLFFDKRDNPSNDEDWNKIIKINENYKQTVTKRLLENNKKFDFQDEYQNIKTGIWLKYNKRNIYKRITKKEIETIKLLTDLRVVDIHTEGKKVKKVICKDKSLKIKEIEADKFYLTAGAIESCRLLLKLNQKTSLFDTTDLGKNFGDHISTELYHVKNTPPIIDGVDFTPYFHNGNLITKRIIVTTKDNLVGFVHCIYNKDIKAFKFIKELLFGKKETKVTLIEFISGFVFLFKFIFHLLFMKNLYVDKAQWSLQLDLEQPENNNNCVKLSDEKDHFGEPIAEIVWSISDIEKNAINELHKKLETLLIQNKFDYDSVYEPSSKNNKVEDVFHPVGCMRMGSDERAVCDFDGKVKALDNMYHYSTALFPSAKSINPSASVYCFVEKHLEGEDS